MVHHFQMLNYTISKVDLLAVALRARIVMPDGIMLHKVPISE